MHVEPEQPSESAIVPAGEFVWDIAPLGEVASASKNPVIVYLASLPSDESKRTQRSALVGLAKMLMGEGTAPERVPWHDLRHAHTAALRAKVIAQHAPATSKRMICALRGVLKACWRLELMAHEDYGRAVDLGRVTGSRLPRGRALTQDEVIALFRATAPDWRGYRDRAILALFLAGALRRSELSRVRAEDINVIERTVTVIGKGNKQRVVPLAHAVEHVLAWVRERGGHAGRLVVRADAAGGLTRKGISPGGLYYVLSELGEKCGIEFTPHDCRRTRLTELIASGVDIAHVATFAGHSSVDTTKIYDMRKQAALAAAVENVGFQGGATGTR